MYFIRDVEIAGFWGRHVAKASLHRNVTLPIGKNGSGKTTFMDLLQGVLRVDLRLLSLHPFSSIVITLANENGAKRTIKVTRETKESPVELLRFQIGNRAIRLPIYSAEMDSVRHLRVRPRLAEQYQKLRDEMSALVSVASLSVHRTSSETVSDDDYPSRGRVKRSPVDERLEELSKRLQTYQLSRADQTAKISAEFQRKVLASNLFDKNFDTYTARPTDKLDLERHEADLTNAYRDLGLLDEGVVKRIHEHFKAIARSISAINLHLTEKKALGVNEVMPLPLLRRTQHIIDLSLDAETQRRAIAQPKQQYLQILQSFFLDTKVQLSDGGDLSFSKGDKAIDIGQLSSGEKQLVILMTETLLQNNAQFVFLADEPELSLHIAWQSKVIESISSLNNNSQVIVATHSPEIAAGWRECLLDMANVIHG
jgi:predicted ATP-dependent endonuclease of OLD family